MKTLGIVADRSIWSLEPVRRWIAPMDFYERLVTQLGSRLEFNTPVDFAALTAKSDAAPVISTAPMPIVGKALVPELAEGLQFNAAPVHVLRGKVHDCSVHQTIYYPSPHHPLYRASITGNSLILEFTEPPIMRERMARAWEEFLASFGVEWGQIELETESHPQRYGKIAAIDEGVRNAIITAMSTRHNIHSLGRFATWRNILLDDIVHDCSVIKQLIKTDDYRRRLIQSQLGNQQKEKEVWPKQH